MSDILMITLPMFLPKTNLLTVFTFGISFPFSKQNIIDIYDVPKALGLRYNFFIVNVEL